MSFKIIFTDSPAPADWVLPGEKAVLGKVVINDFEESLAIVTGYWAREDYIKQWIEALDMFIDSPACVKSALVTQIYDPAKAEPGYVVEWWVLYKGDNKVYVQNQYVSRNSLSQPFDPDSMYSYIDKRETVSEEGDAISEWTTTLSALKEFVAELKR